jgi:multisubunit Na+/H+ antiporter MnhB subunit
MSVEIRVHNRHGDRVDPVPFLVTVGLAFAFALSFGPIYGLSYGLTLSASLALSTLAFAVAAAVAYRQLVRRAPPLDAGPLPPGPRVERLLYAGIGLGVLLVGLTVPLL